MAFICANGNELCCYYQHVCNNNTIHSIAQNDYVHFKEMFEHRIKQNGTGSYTIFFITCVCVLVCCVSIINFSVMVYQIIFVQLKLI